MKNKEHVDAFERFSTEMTFMSSFTNQISKTLVRRNDDSSFQSVLHTVLLSHARDFVRNHSDELTAKNSTVVNCEVDHACIEVQFNGIHKNYKEFLNYYRHVLKVTKKYGFSPSSRMDLEWEGGCHMNFDLSGLSKRTQTFANDFIKNLINYTLNNPSLVWFFGSPHNNNAYKLTLNEHHRLYSKGDFMTVRKSSDSLGSPEYVELRYFVMPRRMSEMKLHYDFCRKLLLYIQRVTMEKNHVKLSNPECYTKTRGMPYKTSKLLKTYTYEKSISEIQDVFYTIGMDYSLAKAEDKEELLKLRFENGPKWLV